MKRVVFKKHVDTEKESGMLETLVIQLPSIFTGGTLAVEFGKEVKKMIKGDGSGGGFYGIAFYVDCEHELLPVESGWRL